MDESSFIAIWTKCFKSITSGFLSSVSPIFFSSSPNKGGNNVLYDVGRCLLSDMLLDKRMTQQDLAERLGVTRQQINHYSRDKRIMSLPIAKNIATALDCNIEDLYEWIPVKARNKRR